MDGLIVSGSAVTALERQWGNDLLRARKEVPLRSNLLHKGNKLKTSQKCNKYKVKRKLCNKQIVKKNTRQNIHISVYVRRGGKLPEFGLCVDHPQQEIKSISF